MPYGTKTHGFNQSGCPVKSPLSELNTGQIPMYTKHRMNGDIETRFHVNIIDLLDQIFIHDALRYGSIEQERFFKMFFEQAGIATDVLQLQSKAEEMYPTDACDELKGIVNEDKQAIMELDPYEHMEAVFRELDNFLGAYKGCNNGRYKR